MVLATHVCQCFTDRELPERICWWARKYRNICWNYTWCPSRVFLLLLPQWLLTSNPFRTAPDILPNGLQSLPLSTQQKLYVSTFHFSVDSLSAYTKLTKRQICQDDVNWLHLNWIIYMIWLIKYSAIIGISIFTEKHPPNEDNSKALSTLLR